MHISFIWRIINKTKWLKYLVKICVDAYVILNCEETPLLENMISKHTSPFANGGCWDMTPIYMCGVQSTTITYSTQHI